jgi:hypothetical protein
MNSVECGVVWLTGGWLPCAGRSTLRLCLGWTWVRPRQASLPSSRTATASSGMPVAMATQRSLLRSLDGGGRRNIFFSCLSVRAAERPARVFFHFSEMLDGGAPAAGDEVQFYSIRMFPASFASRACGWRHNDVIMAMQRSRAATTRSARCGLAGCPRDRSNLTYAVRLYIGPIAPSCPGGIAGYCVCCQGMMLLAY